MLSCGGFKMGLRGRRGEKTPPSIRSRSQKSPAWGLFGTVLPVLGLTRATLIPRLKCVQVFLWDGPLAGAGGSRICSSGQPPLLNGRYVLRIHDRTLREPDLAVTGPIFHYSATWQLGSASCSEYAEPRYSGLHLKLSELIVALKPADNGLAATHWHDRENQVRQNCCN
jgi:hypothetical protein